MIVKYLSLLLFISIAIVSSYGTYKSSMIDCKTLGNIDPYLYITENRDIFSIVFQMNSDYKYVIEMGEETIDEKTCNKAKFDLMMLFVIMFITSTYFIVAIV